MNNLTINFNKNLYSKKAINLAIKDFIKLCEIQLIEDKINFIIKIKLNENISEKEIQEVKDEFCNFALGYMKNE
ncbi:MAG: HxsD-like protein [Candidatus Woesearchaeota archaeon]